MVPSIDFLQVFAVHWTLQRARDFTAQRYIVTFSATLTP
jgi:hypothetical protein